MGQTWVDYGPLPSSGRLPHKDVSELVPEYAAGASKLLIISVPGGIVIILISM